MLLKIMARFYISFFSTKLFTKEIIKETEFNWVKKAIKLKFNGIEDIFDRNEYCVLVDQDDKRQYARYSSKKTNEKYKAPGYDYELLCKILIDIKTPHKVRYVDENDPFSDNHPRDLTLIDSQKTLSVSNNVGCMIDKNLNFENEIKFVIEIMSTQEVEIKDIKRIELKLNDDVILEKLDIPEK